jgi:hypothetical protein
MIPCVIPHLKNTLRLLGIEGTDAKEELLDTIKVPLKLDMLH